MNQPYFTIFTSVYNRKHTIHRVWESLIDQTNKNFEWILIDNGSADDIIPLLEEYKKKADFDVRIFAQENQGKYMAFNRAVDLAKGELFIPADSDDWFEHNTIERLSKIWKEHKSDEVSGINVLCKYEDGNIVGEKYPFEGVSTFAEIHYKHGVGGEKWGCVRVDLLKKYRFPTDFKVTNFPDVYIWGQIGLNYKCVFINEPLRTYYQDAGNQETHVKDISPEYMRMKNFFTTWTINYLYPKVEKYVDIREYLQTFTFLWLTAFRAKIPISKVIKNIERTKSKFVALLLLIPSYIIKVFNLQLNFLRKKKYKYQY